MDLVATGRLHPAWGLVADCAQLSDVLAALNERRLSGKAVVTIG